MRAVQQSQLGAIVGSNIIGDDHSRALPVRSFSGSAVLDDPLHETFALHRPAIRHPEYFRDTLPQIIRGGGSNAVDHGTRECDFLFDPTRQAGVRDLRELLDGAAEPRAVID